jgi:hypothetical protein
MDDIKLFRNSWSVYRFSFFKITHDVEPSDAQMGIMKFKNQPIHQDSECCQTYIMQNKPHWRLCLMPCCFPAGWCNFLDINWYFGTVSGKLRNSSYSILREAGTGKCKCFCFEMDPNSVTDEWYDMGWLTCWIPVPSPVKPPTAL